MAVRDIPGRPVVGFFSFTPYPAIDPRTRPVVVVEKKRPKVGTR